MNTAQKGATFERLVVNTLRELGFDASRHAASKGVVDIEASIMEERGMVALGIQCKNAKRPISVEEWNTLVDHCKAQGKIPMVAEKIQGRSSFSLSYCTSRAMRGGRHLPRIEWIFVATKGKGKQKQTEVLRRNLDVA